MITIAKNWRDVKPPLGSQINWGYPLSQGLMGCWLINEIGGRRVTELARQNNATLAQSIVFSSSKLGFALNNPIATGFINPRKADDYFMREDTPITLVCMFNCSSIGGEGGARLLCRGTGEINFRLLATITLGFSVAGTTTLVRTSSNNSWVVNKNTFATVTWDGTVNASNVHIYVNGRETSYQTTTNGASLTNNSTVRMQLARSLSGFFSYGLVYNRILTSYEILSLYEAPYQFIKPIKRTIYFVPSGVSATTRRGFMRYGKYWG